MALLKLLCLCGAMFLGAFVCGEVPLRCSMNQRSMKYITTVGVGLLIGVSFIVIIPEGVHTYYGAKPTSVAPSVAVRRSNATATAAVEHDHDHEHAHGRRLFEEVRGFDGDDEAPQQLSAAVKAATAAVAGSSSPNAPLPSAIGPDLRSPSLSAEKPDEEITVDLADEASAVEAAAAVTDGRVEDADEDALPVSANAIAEHDHEHDHDDHDEEHTPDDGGEEPEGAHVHDEQGHAHGHAHVHEECVDVNRSSANVGAALVLGFVVMFLVDRLGGGDGHGHGHGGGMASPGGGGGGAHAHSHGSSGSLHRPHQPKTSHIHIHPTHAHRDTHRDAHSLTVPSGSNKDHPRASSASSDEEKKELLDHSPLRIQTPVSPGVHEDMTLAALPAPQFDQTATIGILVHSAIDGLALGAISVSDNSSLELVVFFAIILHKAPAAFGLTSFLLHQGRDRGEVRKHLLYFSLAAPLTSLLTFISFSGYNGVAGASKRLNASSADGQALLGLCLLFSAGTFLFTIAAHILPEIQPATAGGGGGGAGASSSAGSSAGHGNAAAAKPQWNMLLALIVGILAPLLFSSHNHGH